jgi:hypothetical protein
LWTMPTILYKIKKQDQAIRTQHDS